jgi:hypothetical protein
MEAWTPSGRPLPGDTLIIGPGTAGAPSNAEVNHGSLTNLTILLDDGPGGTGSPFLPTLSLSNSVIGHGTLIENRFEPSPFLGASDTELILVEGTVRNFGTIAENPAALIGNTLDITIGPDGRLINTKSGTISGSTISHLNIEGGTGSRLVNNGTISGHGAAIDIGVPVFGGGTFDMSRGANPGSHSGTAAMLEFGQAVGAGETIRVNDTTLVLDQPLTFLAVIDDLSVTPASPFATDSSVILKGRHATDLAFQRNVLTVHDGARTVAHLRFSAGLDASDFLLTDTTQGASIALVAPSAPVASAGAQIPQLTAFPPLPDRG